MSASSRLSAADLIELAQRPRFVAACSACAALVCPGWESLPAHFSPAALQRVGSLRDPAVDEPTLDEQLPAGVHGWSADAPVDPRWHPYNRCDVWACRTCGRPFLRYTEYGGYYIDERVRELHAERVQAP